MLCIRYTLAGILQHWLEYLCKLTVAFRYTLPRILQEWSKHFCKLTVDFRYTPPRILLHWLEHFYELAVDFRYTLPRILLHWLEYFCKLKQFLGVRNNINLVKRKQVNEAKKVVCRWELLNILISSRVFRFFLKILNLDQYAIGIGKIPILASVLNSYDTHKMTPNREYLTESDI